MAGLSGLSYNRLTGLVTIKASSISVGSGSNPVTITGSGITTPALQSGSIQANSVSANTSTSENNSLQSTSADYTSTQPTSNTIPIVNKPALAQVALSGAYSSLSGLPNLSTISANAVTLTGNLSANTVTAASLNTQNASVTNSLSAGSVSATSVRATANVIAPLINLPNANFTGVYGELKGLPSTATATPANLSTLTVQGPTVANTVSATAIAANTLSLSANVNYPIFNTQRFSAGPNGYSHAFQNLNPIQAAGETSVIQVGQATTANNCSYFGHVNNGPGSGNNFATIGMFASDRILNVAANKRVGINTTTPGAALDVVGNAQIIAAGNVASLVLGTTADGGPVTRLATYSLGTRPAPFAFSDFGIAGAGSPVMALEPRPGLQGTYVTPQGLVSNSLYILDHAFNGRSLVTNGPCLLQGAVDISHGILTAVGGIVTGGNLVQQKGAVQTRWAMATNVSVPATGIVTLTGWGATAQFPATTPCGISTDGTTFTFNVAGIYSLLGHGRFQNTASENAFILFSAPSGTRTYGNGTRILTADGTAFDITFNITTFFNVNDAIYIAAYSTATNTILNGGDILTFFQATLVTRTA